MDEWSESRWFGLADKEYRSNQQKIMEIAEDIDDGRLLDIGCNDGSFSIEIADHIKAKEIYGIEIDANIAKKAEEKGIRIKVHDANLRFPFESAFFDAIVSNQVFEHLVNTDGFFREIHRVLKKDGFVIISTQNLASLHNSIPLLLGMQPVSLHISEIQVGNFLRGVGTHGHIRVPTLLSLREMAVHHGFSIEKVAGVGFYPFPHSLSHYLTRFFTRWAVFITIKLRKTTNK